MFEKLREYVEKVDGGLIDQKNSHVENDVDFKIHPDNNYYENHGKLMEIKDYIESHIHGITVQVSGGEKIYSKEKIHNEAYNQVSSALLELVFGKQRVAASETLHSLNDENECYNRRPIVIRTFKHNNPYTYNEVKIDGIFMDERDGAMRVYDNYIGFFIEGSKYIKAGTVSLWEHFISQWLDDNNFHEQGYYCSDNQLFKLSDEGCELIIADVVKEVSGVSEIKIDSDDLEYDMDLVVICHDKQVLIGYKDYYIMETK